MSNPNSKYDGADVIIAIVCGLMITIIFSVIFYGGGYSKGIIKGIETMQNKATLEGVADWTIDEKTGEAKFKWKTDKNKEIEKKIEKEEK